MQLWLMDTQLVDLFCKVNHELGAGTDASAGKLKNPICFLIDIPIQLTLYQIGLFHIFFVDSFLVDREVEGAVTTR